MLPFHSKDFLYASLLELGNGILLKAKNAVSGKIWIVFFELVKFKESIWPEYHQAIELCRTAYQQKQM